MSRIRVGLGTDLHRLEAGRPLVVGGIEIPHDSGAAGHSDGDAALHALTDALLGAAAAGDVGELFPDDDPATRGLDSAVILKTALGRIQSLGFRVVNVDVVVELERPRLWPHRQAIRERVAELLGVSPERVGFKAKTAEGLGDVGAGKAIVARAIAQLEIG